MRNYDIGFFSSADRGLDILLDMIPQIEEKLGRKVTTCWAYGWDTFDKMHSKNTEMMKWKWQVIRKMNDVGMESKGRLNHQDLADLMKDTKVWAYPTEFTEIHCITALKAQEAGCIPVVTKVAALAETVVNGRIIDCTDIYSNRDAQENFINQIVAALKDKSSINGKEYDVPPTMDNKVENRYWPDVAKVWDKVLA